MNICTKTGYFRENMETSFGIIYADDVLRLCAKKEAESLYDFAGVHAEESVLDPAWYKSSCAINGL